MTLRAAVIGSGPSGFYTTGLLLKAGFAVDLYDVLPTPFGLVRAGVAPDHPNIKAVTRVFEKTAGHEAFRFFGDVELGVNGRDSSPFGGESGPWREPACCWMPPSARRSLPAIGAEALWHAARSCGLSAWRSRPFVFVSREFCCRWVVACRVPVLVVERGVCERRSPAGHGRPAEWARTEASRKCATVDARTVG